MGLPVHQRPGVFGGYRAHGGAGASLVARAFKAPEEAIDLAEPAFHS